MYLNPKMVVDTKEVPEKHTSGDSSSDEEEGQGGGVVITEDQAKVAEAAGLSEQVSEPCSAQL